MVTLVEVTPLDAAAPAGPATAVSPDTTIAAAAPAATSRYALLPAPEPASEPARPWCNRLIPYPLGRSLGSRSTVRAARRDPASRSAPPAGGPDRVRTATVAQRGRCSIVSILSFLFRHVTAPATGDGPGRQPSGRPSQGALDASACEQHHQHQGSAEDDDGQVRAHQVAEVEGAGERLRPLVGQVD